MTNDEAIARQFQDAEAMVFARIPARQRPVVQQLRDLVHEAVPAVKEKPQPRSSTFNFDHNGALASIMGFANWASIGFVRGDQLTDPAGVLEGSGKGMRNVRINRGQDLPVDALRDLIRQAAALNEELGPPPGRGRSWGGGA